MNGSNITIENEFLIVYAKNTGNKHIFNYSNELYILMEGRTWSEDKDGYLRAKMNGITMRAPWLVVGKPNKGYVVHHINHNIRDNTKDNLIIISKKENTRAQNAHLGKEIPFKGVSKRGKKYRARICSDREHIELGIFENVIEAARAYDKAARDLFGDFALTNEKLGLLST